MSWKENDPAFYRPENRPFKHLSNEELQALFNVRASKVVMDPKGFWDDNTIVYWDMRHKLKALYDIMLEIQSRFPKREIYYEGKPPGAYFEDLLPLNEHQYIQVAEVQAERDRKIINDEKKRVYGLRELSSIDPSKDSKQKSVK